MSGEEEGGFTARPWMTLVSLKKNYYLRFYLFFLFLPECQILHVFLETVFSKRIPKIDLLENLLEI